MNYPTDKDMPKAGNAADTCAEEAVYDQLPELVAAYPALFTSREFAEMNSDLPAGWYGLVAQLCRRITEELAAEERFFILQIKEKLGALRIYCRGPERFFALVEETCLASRLHCATCGVAIAEPAPDMTLPLCARHIPPAAARSGGV